ncbi:hypothetical protein Mterra_01206 [Calidithermus terrae]|uniref:Uncharacterized protein n=1 Tax=Calidithermus terrae TaxID=1408545 RepID=A0A399ETM6_9DEIN|nr:hypothetical protein [Calidithermus terrae]RIH87338.1 hypothetical protein Mterra_01206 [Calidithermus terrae]
MGKHIAFLVLAACLFVGCGKEAMSKGEQETIRVDWSKTKIESIGNIIVSDFLKSEVLRTLKLTRGPENQTAPIPYKAVTFVQVGDQISKDLDTDPFTNPIEVVRKTGSFIVDIEPDGAVIYYPVWSNPRNEPPALSEVSSDSPAPQQVCCILGYKIDTRVSYSSDGDCCKAYVGALRNHTDQPATISVTVSHTATSSISGGFDQGKIKYSINWQSSTSRTWTVSQTVSPHGLRKIYAFGTGRRYYGEQYKYPATASSCSAAPAQCSATGWSAFVAQGIGYTITGSY